MRKTQPAAPPFSKNLSGFYIKHAIRENLALIAAWTMLRLIQKLGDGSLWPWVQKRFIALFEAPARGGDFIGHAMPTIIMIFVLDMAVNVAAASRAKAETLMRNKARMQLSELLHGYVHSQSAAFWSARMAGKVHQQTAQIVNGFLSCSQFVDIFGALAIAGLNLGMITGINSKIAWFLGIVFAMRVAYSVALMRPMNKTSMAASDSSSSLSGKIIDSITNHAIVKIFAGWKSENAQLRPVRQKEFDDRNRAGFWQRQFWTIPMFAWDIAFAIVMYMCVDLYADGLIKISEIVFTISVYMSIMNAVGQITDIIPNLVDSISGAQKAYNDLIEPISVADAPNAPALHVSGGAIEFRHVSFKYRRKNVISDLSLRIRPGEKIGLVGGSGAGKTTIVNLLMRLYDPANGAILIDGQDIRGVNQDSLRASISFIPQDPAMFNRTIRENIEYGRIGASLKEIRAAAKSAQIDDFIMHADKKYDALVGDRGIKLSGGQRQRIAIARVFLKNAPILILDEATSALDSETENAIQRSFDELSRGRTTIAIAHRLSTLRNMDRIIVIDKGRIKESGTHARLLRRGGIYAKLWKLQSGGFIKERGPDD